LKLGRLFLFIIVIASTAFGQEISQQSPIGYATVEQAFKALESDSEAKITEFEGWTIFNQKGDGSYILWSFTPHQHPAHPTAIRREIVKRDEEILINMNALCESGKFECDQLIDQFKQINENIKKQMLGNS
jgi:hypothetical protein